MKRTVSFLVILIILSIVSAEAGVVKRHKTFHRAAKRQAAGVRRDSHGRIKRDPAARAKFMRQHPCPSTGRRYGRCPGYIVDHIIPLKRGGPDRPSNMQWQTIADAKAKDKVE